MVKAASETPAAAPSTSYARDPIDTTSTSTLAPASGSTRTSTPPICRTGGKSWANGVFGKRAPRGGGQLRAYGLLGEAHAGGPGIILDRLAERQPQRRLVARSGDPQPGHDSADGEGPHPVVAHGRRRP